MTLKSLAIRFIVCAALLLVATLFTLFFVNRQNVVVIANGTMEQASISVEISGEVVWRGELGAQSSQVLLVFPSTDTSITLDTKWQNRSFKVSAGYLTPGSGDLDVLTLSPDGAWLYGGSRTCISCILDQLW